MGDGDDDWIVVEPSVECSDDGFEILVKSVVIVENDESVVVSSFKVVNVNIVLGVIGVLVDEAKLENEFDSLEENSVIIAFVVTDDDDESSSVVGSLVLGVICVVFVVLMVIKVVSGVDGFVSSIFVAELADIVEVVSSSVEDSFGTVVVLVVVVDEWSMKDDVESVSLVEVLVVVGEELLKVKSTVFNSVVLVLNVVEVKEVNCDCSLLIKVELIVVVSIVFGLFVEVVIVVESFVVKEEGSFEFVEENDSGVILVVSVLTVVVVVVGDDDSDLPVESNKSEIVDFVIMLLVEISLIISNVEVGVKFVKIVDGSAELIVVEDSSNLVPVVEAVGCGVDALVISSVVKIELVVVVRVVKYGFVDSSVIVEKIVGFVESSVER